MLSRSDGIFPGLGPLARGWDDCGERQCYCRGADFRQQRERCLVTKKLSSKGRRRGRRRLLGGLFLQL